MAFFYLMELTNQNSNYEKEHGYCAHSLAAITALHLFNYEKVNLYYCFPFDSCCRTPSSKKYSCEDYIGNNHPPLRFKSTFMKPVIKLITCLLITVILFLNSCKKEYSCENCIGNNEPPVAHAGKDTIIILPVDSVILDGRASTDDKKIVSYQWTKISGPDTFKILQPTAAKTVVNKLVKGVFEFELKVTDAGMQPGFCAWRTCITEC